MRLAISAAPWSVLSCLCLISPAIGMFTADLEDLGMPPDSVRPGIDGSGGFTSRGVHFGNTYDSTFGIWSGFAASTIDDSTTSGFGNQFASAAGRGQGGSPTYAVGFDDAFGAEADVMTLPTPSGVEGMYVNNTTYAALSMLHGDAFAKQFGGPQGTDPDFFRLSIAGRDRQGAAVGTVEVFLADYRFDNPGLDYILTDWTWVDLTALGDSVSTLHFQLSSSDVGQFGMNTPAYFAVDSLVVVPEPGTWVLGLIGALVITLRRTRPQGNFDAAA